MSPDSTSMDGNRGGSIGIASPDDDIDPDDMDYDEDTRPRGINDGFIYIYAANRL